MMTRALHSKDELFHVFLYSWMLSEDLSDLLVEVFYLLLYNCSNSTTCCCCCCLSALLFIHLQIKTPFVENFLKYKVRTEVCHEADLAFIRRQRCSI